MYSMMWSKMKLTVQVIGMDTDFPNPNTPRMKKDVPFLVILSVSLAVALFSTGCASTPVNRVELMPAPDVYGDGILNPLPTEDPFETIPYGGILFATDRTTATTDDSEQHYLNERGHILRLGLAEIQFGEKESTWEYVRQTSLLKTRATELPVTITNVEEWGMMRSSLPEWFDLKVVPEKDAPSDATGRYAKAINAQLAVSKKKHVYIYVHGYKVVFENPILVSAELWHFLGYEGAFIAYSWPSTPSRYAYIKDSDTAAGFARNLRLLLEFIADSTDAEEIHVIGYSNGTRLVTRAMEQLALIHSGDSADQIFEKLRIKNVILVGSDLDRGVFGVYLSDGLLNVSNHLSVYMSQHDKALGVSYFLTRRERLGQLWGGINGELNELTRQAMIKYQDRLSFINVTDAEGADTGNGHGYFRSSPWASSDVLMSMYYDLSPASRGLIRDDDMPIYTFPEDYISRLWQAIKTIDPRLAKFLDGE